MIIKYYRIGKFIQFPRNILQRLGLATATSVAPAGIRLDGGQAFEIAEQARLQNQFIGHWRVGGDDWGKVRVISGW